MFGFLATGQFPDSVPAVCVVCVCVVWIGFVVWVVCGGPPIQPAGVSGVDMECSQILRLIMFFVFFITDGLSVHPQKLDRGHTTTNHFRIKVAALSGFIHESSP